MKSYSAVRWVYINCLSYLTTQQCHKFLSRFSGYDSNTQAILYYFIWFALCVVGHTKSNIRENNSFVSLKVLYTLLLIEYTTNKNT